jgi:hypothetical protein
VREVVDESWREPPEDASASSNINTAHTDCVARTAEAAMANDCSASWVIVDRSTGALLISVVASFVASMESYRRTR